jgi:hypothetical protein
MNKKAILAMASGLSALALAATCGPALAFGPHGHGHGHHGGDMQYFLLARAAGITGAQIHQAFETAGPTLKEDFQTLKTDKAAVDACIIAGTAGGCSTQIGKYITAQNALTQEKLSIWQGLFATPGLNNTAAINLKSNLEKLNADKRALLKGVFSSAKDSDSTPDSALQ